MANKSNIAFSAEDGVKLIESCQSFIAEYASRYEEIQSAMAAVRATEPFEDSEGKDHVLELCGEVDKAFTEFDEMLVTLSKNMDKIIDVINANTSMNFKKSEECSTFLAKSAKNAKEYKEKKAGSSAN